MDLVLDKEKIPGLKGVALKDQLKLSFFFLKSEGAPNLKQGSLPTKVGDICKALTDAIDLHTSGTWKLVQDEETEAEDLDIGEGEGKEEGEGEDVWKDIETIIIE